MHHPVEELSGKMLGKLVFLRSARVLVVWQRCLAVRLARISMCPVIVRIFFSEWWMRSQTRSIWPQDVVSPRCTSDPPWLTFVVLPADPQALASAWSARTPRAAPNGSILVDGCFERLARLLCHQCRYGAVCEDADGAWKPVRKSTTLATTKRAVAQAMNLRCEGDHQHCKLEDSMSCSRFRKPWLEWLQQPWQLRNSLMTGLWFWQLMMSSREKKSARAVKLKETGDALRVV